MINWKPIDTAPKDGTSILVYYEFATVPIVHIAHWDSADLWEDKWKDEGFKSKEEAVGWWSYVENSVSQHKLEEYNLPTHWAEMSYPT